MLPPITPADALGLGTKIGAGGFAAIDFETATRSRASACAVGVAVVEGGQVTSVSRWLIQPPGNAYEGINISIHGISPKMTADAPRFGEVWPKVKSVIGRLPIVAHNASFDLSVLRSSMLEANMRWPRLTYLCTYLLAKQTWPGWPHYRLTDVAVACGIEFEHHEAGSDAAAAAELGIAFCGVAEEVSIIAASSRLGVRPGELRSDSWSACSTFASVTGEHSGTPTAAVARARRHIRCLPCERPARPVPARRDRAVSSRGHRRAGP